MYNVEFHLKNGRWRTFNKVLGYDISGEKYVRLTIKPLVSKNAFTFISHRSIEEINITEYEDVKEECIQ